MPLFDENVLDFLRKQRTFGGDSPFGIPQDNPQPQAAPLQMSQPQNDVFQPAHRYEDQYKQTIDSMPQRPHPGLGRKILGVIGAIAGGPGLQDEIMNHGYNEQMQDWKTKMEPMGKLASLEDKNNSEGRQLWQNQQLDKNRAGVLSIREEAEQRRREKDANDFDIKNRRLELDTELANGGRAISDRDGNMFIVTKRGEVKDIDKTTYSLADRMRLAQEGKMTIVNDQQEAARELARLRANLESGLIQERGAVAKDVNAAKADKGETPNETKTAQYIKAQEWYNKHPNAKKYLNLGEPGANTFSMTEPSGSWFRDASSDDVNEYKQATDFIYGKGSPGTSAPVSTTKPKPQLPNIQSAPAPGMPPVGQSRPVITPNNNGHTPVGRGAPVTNGTPPPIEQRVVGQVHTFPNGNQARWDGTQWIKIGAK